MKNFCTSKHYDRLIFIAVLFGLPVIIFLNIPLILRLVIVLIFVGVIFSSTLDMIVDQKKISIKYPFLLFWKDNVINWESLSKVVVVYRSGLTHGSMMPSYIEFTENKMSKKVNYRLSKEELQILEELVKSKKVAFECINNPYKNIE